MLNYQNAIKELRLLREIPQENMLETKNRSQFSKIERGILSIKLEDFVEIADTLGVTNEELIVYTNTENPQEQLLMLFRECVQDLSDTQKKKKFLKLFAPIQKKKDSDLSRIEYNFKYSVQASLSSYWIEIDSFDLEKVTTLFNHLIDNNYFSQYDYMLALNISKLFSKEQMKMIVSKMFPLKNLITRNALCKQYANLLMTNAISFFVYEKDYDLALKYIEKAQNELNYSDSYYLHLNLLYHKNLTLSLQKNESKYITETRKVIQIVEAIGDSYTASMMTKELDQFIYNPDYSPGRKNIVETSAST